MKNSYFSKVRFFIFENKFRLIILQLVFTAIVVYLSLPLISRGFYLAMKLSGYSAITKENFFDVLIKPGSVLYILMVIFAVMLFMLLNITLYVVMFDRDLKESRKGFAGYVIQVGKHFFKFVFSKKITGIFYMIPFALAIYLPAFILIMENNSVTKYMLKYCAGIMGTTLFLTVVIVIYLVCIIVFMNKFPYIRYLILEDENKKRIAARTRVERKILLRQIIFQVLWEMAVLVVCIIIYVAFTAVSILAVRVISDGDNMLILFYEAYKSINNVVSVLIFFICGMLNMASALQISRKRKIVYPIDKLELKRQTWVAITAIVIVAGIAAIYLSIRMFSAGSTPTYASLGDTLVTAHRGASSSAPENTIPAIEAAIAEGADYVEIDVRLTSDGEIVLMHDPTTKRTAGVNLKVCDSTYEELLQLDVGSYYSEEFAGTYIPTLEEVMDICKGEIMMNIELKTVTNDGELEEKVAALITEKNMEEQCVVTSFKQKSLVRIKEYNSDIVTGYIYTFGYSNNTDYEAMDILSIDAKYLDSQVVEGAHKKGITVYAWTVNTKSEIRRMAAIGVDNIITDNVTLTKEILYDKNSNQISDIIKYVLEMGS